MSGMNDFAPFQKKRQCFTVRNISDPKKTVRIFHYPITYGYERDLLDIPGVAEADIRSSLLKGEIMVKLFAKEIIVTCSDIDLLQFNDEQKQFLKDSGIIKGTEIGIDQIVPGTITGGGGTPVTLDYVFRQGVQLIGVTNAANRIFTTPDRFINGMYSGNLFRIQVRHNGRTLKQDSEYIVQESAGPGTGYDTVIITSFSPAARSQLMCDYVVQN